jgi:hypothetical protein
MAKLISEFLSSDTFTSFRYKILIRNETSHTQVNKTEVIFIKELKDNGLILEMPLNSCQKGHSLTLFFLAPETQTLKIKLPDTGPFKEAILEAIAKVEQIEANENNKKRILVDMNFTQIDLKLWKKIIDQYAAKQRNIDDMMMKQYKDRHKS